MALKSSKLPHQVLATGHRKYHQCAARLLQLPNCSRSPEKMLTSQTMCFRLMQNVSCSHRIVSRVMLRGKRAECSSEPTACLLKTMSMNELLLQFHLGNYPVPTPFLPPRDILSSHSTTRSLQIPFPWVEFSHSCLPGC